MSILHAVTPAGRRTIALTNSRKAADVILAQGKADGLDYRWHINWVDGYGWCHNIHVDAARYEEWIAS